MLIFRAFKVFLLKKKVLPHLQEFIANEGGGEAPLEGAIPDMTSSTELVITVF